MNDEALNELDTPIESVPEEPSGEEKIEEVIEEEVIAPEMPEFPPDPEPIPQSILESDPSWREKSVEKLLNGAYQINLNGNPYNVNEGGKEYEEVMAFWESLPDDSELKLKETPLYQRYEVKKLINGNYFVNHGGILYSVCSKDIDPSNAYDIDEVAAFWESLSEDDPRKQVEILTLEDVKASKLREIGVAYSQYDEEGVATTAFGWPIQIGQAHCTKLDGAIRFAEMTGQAAIYITDANNETHYNISITDAKQVLVDQMAAALRAHAKKQQLRAAVEEATTIEAIQAIVWI